MADLVKRLREVAAATGPNDAAAIVWDAAARIEALTTQLCEVLNREAETTARYDAKIEALTAERDAAIARAEAAEADKAGLQSIAGDLLTRLDDWDRELAEETRGHTMHVYGMTPDWYVNAAHWVCYGYGYGDPRQSSPNTENSHE
jgi:transposase